MNYCVGGGLFYMVFRRAFGYWVSGYDSDG